MRTVPKWVDKIQDTEKQEQCIYDLCFNPDGTQLIVASGSRVLVYDAINGTMLQPLKGHKDDVYCVCYARNGQKFASGSADKTVIVWSNRLEGLLKYTHSDAVQCLAYNPLSHLLASCAQSDFAFWSAEQKAVQKFKTSARINACGWTNDGQYIALGLGNGTVSIRNKLGEEKVKIERPEMPSIWAIAWSTVQDDQTDLLCVTDWDRNLSFYTLGGKLVGKERQIGYNAMHIAYFPSGDYLLICGTNRSCTMYTKDGIKLGLIGEEQKSWVWTCAIHPTGNYIVFGCQDGTVAYYQLVLNTVHGLYKERYAYREHMTDVIIQHLLTEQKVRIKCRDLIRKIAIFKNRLAVQLPERVVIYELYTPEDVNDMHYRVREKIQQRLDCSLLVICSEHLVVCQEKTVTSLTFSGARERQWSFDAAIRYIKIIGGPAKKEGLILGLRSGQVWEVHLDNPFPLLKVTVDSSVRCLDLSQKKQKLAVIDDNGVLQVYNNKTMELLFKEPHTNSVAWNTQFEDMLSFSGPNTLAVKVQDFPAHRQRLAGVVVGLTGSKLFCLNGSAMATMELPLTAPMYQYIEQKMFSDAYKVACLGISDGDWEALGLVALENLDFNIARMAFIKLQDFSYLELIRDLQGKYKNNESKDSIIGDIYSYRGKFKEAAKCYVKAGKNEKALTMYTDLRMFDMAQDFLGVGDNSALVRQKADWARNINEHKAAADMYMSIGDTKSAIEILGDQGWVDQLIDVGKRLDRGDRVALISIAEHLKRLKQSGPAAEVYKRLGDSAAVLKLHVDALEWPQAFQIVASQPQHRALVFVPYALWLAENDKFVQAQKAFHRAGRPDEAFRVLGELTKNAVSECRFNDAGYYYWILSRQCLDLLSEQADKAENQDLIQKHKYNERMAGIYYAYHALHRYLEEPFTSFMTEALFNIARFLMIETSTDQPPGISNFAILYCLSKQARKLGAHKLAKQLLDKIQQLKVPMKFQEQVDIAIIAARAKPYNDPEELLPMCYRCSTYNPLTSTSQRCIHCGQRFVHSYVSFEILPLVEFQLEDGISDVEAVRLIESPPTDQFENEFKMESDKQSQGAVTIMTETLSVNDIEEPLPLIMNRNVLAALDSSTVLICKWAPPMRYQYFRNLLPDLQITMCQSCFKAFHVDDFELQMLQKGHCPYCRALPLNNINIDSTDELLMFS